MILRKTISSFFLIGILAGCTYQSRPVQESIEPYVEKPGEKNGRSQIPATPPEEERTRHPRGPSQPIQQAPAVRYLLGEAKKSMEQGELDQAQSHLERAFRLANRDPWVSFHMSEVLLAKNEAKQAEQWAFQALSYFPSGEWEPKSQAWELIADCRRQRGDLRGANQAQKQADAFQARLRH
ncbi:MAG: tetratricopeptide repeat protein [Oligoflexus sp.]